MTHTSTAQFLVGFLIAAVAGGAVFINADKNGINRPLAWAVGVWLFLIVALPLYVFHLRRVRRTRGQL